MLPIRKSLVLSSLVIMMFLMQPVSNVAEPDWKQSSTLENSQEKIFIYVAEAYYGDLDNDTREDDVYTRIELTLQGANRYNFDLWLTLTLPSGQDFTFGWGINTRLTFLNLAFDLYDTALEPGWYHLHVEIVMKTGGVNYTDVEHIFDPPGDAICCTTPSATMTSL